MWIRYSDLNHDPPEIVEFDLAELSARTNSLSRGLLRTQPPLDWT
jgi:hypothetical protein